MKLLWTSKLSSAILRNLFHFGIFAERIRSFSLFGAPLLPPPPPPSPTSYFIFGVLLSLKYFGIFAERIRNFSLFVAPLPPSPTSYFIFGVLLSLKYFGIFAERIWDFSLFVVPFILSFCRSSLVQTIGEHLRGAQNLYVNKSMSTNKLLSFSKNK